MLPTDGEADEVRPHLYHAAIAAEIPPEFLRWNTTAGVVCLAVQTSDDGDMEQPFGAMMLFSFNNN